MSQQNAKQTPGATCPSCGNSAPSLLTIDSGLKLTLAKSGKGDAFDAVCSGCLSQMRSSASLGAQIVASKEATFRKKTELWNSRLGLVKQGRLCLARGDFAEAAVSYEKYLKTVSDVTNTRREDLNPNLFSKTPKEVTVIASVLWDLMMAYDAIVQYHVKQLECAELLAKFLRFSPIYKTVLRRADSESRRAKNPQAFKKLLQLCDTQASRCFIANSTFQSRAHPTVITLCLFRDRILRKGPLGRRMIALYYNRSPWVAEKIDNSPRSQRLLRPVLRGVAFVLKITFRLPQEPDS